ncbi:RagB/SusD family nutrient uptake outer membrane protein [Formosa sp. PL04]|uniref:RagB/SusD family nutrient uptake outer membrane protein n=1 Tax=Formosa sp. PL04 TaxID=3081755 RepID=UPI0029821DFC|nr:RagB/SusD family nutrient uptake outer membrane protein [Formosa sp. PL04]MDW5288086.1 RagB/SusD family nutrient uptake outer membrane protein [Formosa sp. PL04]
MKSNIKNFISMIVIASALFSCSDYLEEINPNNVSADVYWSTLEESNDNLTSVYGAMLNHFILGFEVESWRSDTGFPKSRTSPYGKGLPWYQQTFTNSLSDVSSRWDALYQVIYRANQVIEGLESMGDDLKVQDAWTEQMAQARFFRGLAHFYLHSTYNNGEIIIRDFVPTNSEEFSLPLSSSEEVTAFFRKDLVFAYENLPAKFDTKTRVSAGVAATVLGKSYLYTEEYDIAMTYLNDVISNSAYGYELLEGNNVDLLFTSAGDYNSESIFEINFSDQHQLEDDVWDEESFFNRWARYSAPTGSIQGIAIFIPPSWMTYEYSNEPLDTQDSRNYVDDGNGGIKLRNVPLRAAQMVALVNDEQSEYYLAPAANEIDKFAGTVFSFFKKFTNHDIVASEADIALTPWKSGKNVIVDRLADVYLMYAECLIKTGNIDEALFYINKIRQRWGLVSLGFSDGSAHDFDEVNYNEQTLMNQLMFIDKPLELAVEGYATRSIDLRRWGVAKQRFQDLADMNFYLIDYSYTAEDGTAATRPLSLIQKGISPDDSTNPKVQLKEYEDAAINYNASLHGYLPLPLSEILNNQNLFN